jgi:hypothetical protein
MMDFNERFVVRGSVLGERLQYSFGEYLVQLLDTLRRIADALENKTEAKPLTDEGETA